MNEEENELLDNVFDLAVGEAYSGDIKKIGKLQEKVKFIDFENKQLKEKLQQKEDIIKKAKDYINNSSLYKEEYDYDYEENIYLSGINDEEAKKDLLKILDNKGK